MHPGRGSPLSTPCTHAPAPHLPIQPSALTYHHHHHFPHLPQASSAGSIISFVTGDAAVSRVICEETRLFKITVSFGNVCSLIRCGGVGWRTGGRVGGLVAIRPHPDLPPRLLPPLFFPAAAAVL